jgi:predicted PurR-regulated permease PerM
MENKETSGNGISFNQVVHYALQLLALSLLLAWCFMILQPFVTPLVWAAVLATTLYPVHVFLREKLRNRNGWSAGIITVLMLLIIIGPAFWLMFTTVGEIKILVETYRAGNLHIPMPAESVKSWPVVGNPVYQLWTEASTNLSGFISHHQEDAKNIVLGALGLLKNTGAGIVIFMVSIFISGFLLVYAESLAAFFRQLLIRIAGPTAESMTSVAALTVRNVAKGVLGVAVIQSILAGIGFVLAGIPFAGLWIIICLILAIVQLGLLPVSVGVIIYIWGHADTTTAVLLTIWMIFVGIIDNILKPIMLGKGAPAPMLVVFLGAIGGFMVSGFIGLFTGAIILSLGYKLVVGWVMNSQTSSAGKP